MVCNFSFVKILLFGVFFLSVIEFNGQTQEQLIEGFYNGTNAQEKIYFGKKFLSKAKSEEDTSGVYTGYSLLSSIYEHKDCILYADSLIDLTKNRSSFHYPAMAYIHKANYYTNKFDFTRTIDNIILAKAYGEKHGNENIISECNALLGMAKIKLGDPEAAIELFRQNLYKSRNDTTTVLGTALYLSDIYNLASGYNEIQVIDSAKYYNSLGRKIAKKEGDQFTIRYFNLNASFTEFYDKNLDVAKDSLLSLLPFLKKENDRLNIMESYYYLGKIYSLQDDNKKAFDYFNKIDSSFIENQQFYSKFKDSYYELIKIASKNNEKELQLKYINRLLAIDSITLMDDIYIEDKITREIEIPALIKDKENLIYLLSKKNSIFKNYFFWGILLLVLSVLILIHQFYLRLNYKKQAKLLIKKLNDVNNDISNLNKVDNFQERSIDIPESIIDEILLKLEKFEKSEGFLDNNINLTKLAKIVHSNSKYLSKIINEAKGLSFSDYINGLRINKAIERLKNEQRFRNYTIKAIAQESGFNQAETFAKAFYKRTKVKPSYFIKELNA
jgi:AraC-like DNA-binding protein